MTTTKSVPPDYASGPSSHGAHPHSPPPAPTVRRGDDHGAHLLRLVLDLQLDALLLGLGAAAIQESRSRPSPAPTPTVSDTSNAPWPRWAIEDIDLARTLAAEAVNSGAALPATLGPEPGGQEEPVVLDRLAARYESMRNLLTDLLARGTDLTAVGQAHLHELMAHCQRRLIELRSLSQSAMTGRSTTSPHPMEREYLPGELLG
jgi:hypothetical protein